MPRITILSHFESQMFYESYGAFFNVIPLMFNYTDGLCGVNLHDPRLRLSITDSYPLAVAVFPANFLPAICSPVCAHVFDPLPVNVLQLICHHVSYGIIQWGAFLFALKPFIPSYLPETFSFKAKPSLL